MKKGFTLIELLVIVAIIAILAAIAIPQFTKYKRKSAVGRAIDTLRICVNELATEYSNNSAIKSKDCLIFGSSQICKISLEENSGNFYISTQNCTVNINGYTIVCTISDNKVKCE